jgi:hypothetical protein
MAWAAPLRLGPSVASRSPFAKTCDHSTCDNLSHGTSMRKGPIPQTESHRSEGLFPLDGRSRDVMSSSGRDGLRPPISKLLLLTM